MLIPNRSVRLFKSAARQLFAVLLVSTLFVSALRAQDADQLTVKANINIEPTFVNNQPALTGNYGITCSKQDNQTIYGFGDMRLYYSITVGSDNVIPVNGLSGLYANGGRTDVPKGPLEVTGRLGGARVRAKFSGVYCHHDQQNSELIDVWSLDAIVPPQVSVGWAGDPDNLNAEPYVPRPIPITDVPNVPVGKNLMVILDINAHPQGTESLILHYEGAGAQRTQVLFDIDKDYDPTKEIIKPTETGTLSIWAEFRPTQTLSNVLHFNVVADPNKPKTAGNQDKSKTTGNQDKKIVGNQNKPGAKKPTPIKKTKN